MSEKQTSAKPASPKGDSPKPPADGKLNEQQLDHVSGGVRGPGTQTEDDIYVGRMVRRK